MTYTRHLEFDLVSEKATERRRIGVDNLILAGWTGRDRAAVEAHIAELAELGIAGPATTPIFYRVAAARLTRAECIQVAGGATSGEAEFVLVQNEGRLWVGAGSDQTDREIEAVGITVSKQLCDKPLAGALWPMAEVAGHWDRLVVRSWAVDEGRRVLYQEAELASILSPAELMAGYSGGQATLPGFVDGQTALAGLVDGQAALAGLVDGQTALADGTAMFGGTPPAIGGVRPAERFEFELDDPVLGRKLEHGYDIEVLPVAG